MNITQILGFLFKIGKVVYGYINSVYPDKIAASYQGLHCLLG